MSLATGRVKRPVSGLHIQSRPGKSNGARGLHNQCYRACALYSGSEAYKAL